MATIITTLKTHTNQDTVYPNIREENIPDSSVTVTKIQDGAVSSAKIASGAVTTAKIADGAITYEKIENSAVRKEQLSDGTVSHKKLAFGERIDLATLYAQIDDFDDFYGAVGIMARDWRYKFSFVDAGSEIWYPCFPSMNDSDKLINFLCLMPTGVSLIQWEENHTPAEASNIYVYSVSADSFEFD